MVRGAWWPTVHGTERLTLFTVTSDTLMFLKQFSHVLSWGTRLADSGALFISYKYTHTHTHTHTHIYTYTYIHTHTCTHMYIHSYSHTYTHGPRYKGKVFYILNVCTSCCSLIHSPSLAPDFLITDTQFRD